LVLSDLESTRARAHDADDRIEELLHELSKVQPDLRKAISQRDQMSKELRQYKAQEVRWVDERVDLNRKLREASSSLNES